MKNQTRLKKAKITHNKIIIKIKLLENKQITILIRAFVLTKSYFCFKFKELKRNKNTQTKAKINK